MTTASRPLAATHPNVRRKKRRRLRLSKWTAQLVLRAAEYMSPKLAASLLFRMARRPPRTPPASFAHPLWLSAEHRSVRVGDHSLRVYLWGDAALPMALCVHGWGGSAVQMAPFVEPLLKAGFRVVTFDAPAHGRSDGSVCDPMVFARAIGGVVQSIGDAKVVIGHSFGAAVTLLAIREGKLRPERLVLLGGYAHFDLVLHKMKALFAVGKPVLERAFHRLFGQQGAIEPDRLSPLSALRALDCPTFILHDHDDEIVPIAHANELFAAAKVGALVRTRGLGHHSILNDEVARWCVQVATQSPEPTESLEHASIILTPEKPTASAAPSAASPQRASGASTPLLRS